ncbi:putative peptidase C54 [Blattamonas nauphoetae]|uniref:Cysteine protease n=1 Tax=Blattamonas nauphoetae TaxID=2049346 RepID=A0ABQ9Y9C3_9EUKA|nr:putative peptidase C54 [Blattamonas nauphoetae]
MNNGSGQVVAYLLGHPYVLSLAKPEFLSLVPQTIETGALKQHFSQLFWMSYRKDFQPLNYTSLVTDRGWGCMHRSSQMMMAETIRRISMNEGASLGTPVGQWFSPHVAALALSRISESENDPLIPTVVTVNNLCRLRTEPHTGRTIERGHRIKSSKRGATSRVIVHKNGFSSENWEIVKSICPFPLKTTTNTSIVCFGRCIVSRTAPHHKFEFIHIWIGFHALTPDPTCFTHIIAFLTLSNIYHGHLATSVSNTKKTSITTLTYTSHETSGDNAKHPQMSSLANSSSDELSSFESDGIAPQTPPLTPCDAVEPDMVGIHDYNTLIEEQKNEPDPTVDSVDHQTLNDLKQNEFPVPRPRRRKRNVVVSLSEMPIIPPRPKQIQLLEQSDIKLRTRSFVSPTRNLHYSTPHRDSPFPKQRRKSAACASHQTRLKLLNPSPQSAFHPLLVLAPLRLGLQKINLDYLPAIQAVLSHPNSVGIVGGKPRLSFWFVGYERDNLYYLDPHTTQPAFSLRQLQEFTHHKNPKPLDTSSYHPRQIQKIPFSDLDPSMLLGFLCLSHVEFQSLCSFLSSLSPPLLSVIPKAY